MESLIEFVVNFIAGYPIFATIVMIVGILRVVNKPLFALLHAVASLTKPEWDNEILNKVESSAAYRYVCYFLDYITSVKIKK